MWTGMIFISHCQDFYCLSLRLKCEGINYVADNFKILKIIRDTNTIITKLNNMLVYPKKCLSTCEDKLQLPYEDL